MRENSLVQLLESRCLLSAALPVLPPLGGIINEPVYEYANVGQQVRIGYMPKVNVQQLSQLHGNIDWGDGSDSAANFARDAKGGIDILGRHDYAQTGLFSIGSTITETAPVIPGKPTPEYMMLLGSVSTTARVSPTPAEVTVTAGKPFTVTLAKFNQFTLDVYFTAKISWGDGTVTTGTVTGGDLSQGNWQVQGTHKFTKVGTQAVHVSVYSHVVGSKFVGTPVDYLTLIIVKAAG
jgi:hypothetical protein